MTGFKPLLAGKVQLDKLVFPLLASPKLDGVRATVLEGHLRARSLEPFANRYTQAKFSMKKLTGIDGEFILGSPTAPDVYRRTNQALATIDESPQLTFFAFDDWSEQAPFSLRLERLKRRLENIDPTLDIRPLRHELVEDLDSLTALEQAWTHEGYEGVMLRDIKGRYKFGRSTANEGILLKLKSFEDGEALVIGIEEEMHNANEATVNKLGRTKRSSHKANKIGKGTMGALVVRGIGGPFDGVEFKIGSGFTAADRARTDWLDKIVKYKYFAVGVKDKPRHPVYAGERMAEDMS